MNRVRWAAWGVVNIEALERMQRRNYIKAVRNELMEQKILLDCGGSTKTPYYQFVLPTTDGKTIPKYTAAGPDAFKKVCVKLLERLGEAAHERGEDGSVRGAGA